MPTERLQEDAAAVAQPSPAPTGQWHHVLSNKIARALAAHPTLAGTFYREDADFMAQAADAAARRGYQAWHREYDADVVRWLATNRTATPQRFLEFLILQRRVCRLRLLAPHGVATPKPGQRLWLCGASKRESESRRCNTKRAVFITRDGCPLPRLPSTREAMSTPIYVLRPFGDQLFGTRFAYADILDPQIVGRNEDVAACPCCGRGVGMLPWLPPHRIRLPSSRYPDLLWGAGFDLMVSERFRSHYEAAGLRGIIRFDPPAEFVRVGRRIAAEVRPPPPTYHNVWYLHGGADLDDEASGARRPPALCGCCRQSITAVERIVLRPGSWTGADLFEAWGLPGHLLVSERLKELVEAHALTNAHFIPAEDYHLDWDERRG